MDLSNIFYVCSLHPIYPWNKKVEPPKTARMGNQLASSGMLIAVVATLLYFGNIDFTQVAIGIAIGTVIGVLFAVKVEMTQMPQWSQFLMGWVVVHLPLLLPQSS